MAIEQFKTDEVILSNINQDTIPRQVVMQGEKDGRSLTVQVTNGGVIVPQAGLNVILGWKHRTAKDKEGNLIQGLDAFSPIDRETGLFRIEYTSSMAQPGTIDAEIQFVTSTSVTKSQPFIITVKPSTVDENAVESESSFTVLQEALSQVSQYDGKIQVLEINKADKTDVAKIEDMVSKMPSATPKETFTSLAALNTKYPNGNASAMLVLEPNGELGYVYLWDGNAWIKGSLYQAQGLADESVTTEKLAPAATDYTRTDFLENDPTMNMFDGVYKKGVAVTGPGSDGKLTFGKNVSGRLILLEVNPNTKYSIRRETPSRLHYATATRSLNVGEKMDGSIGKNQSGSTGETETPKEFSITTGENDRYLYLSMSVDGKEPFVRIVEGELPIEETWRYAVKPNAKLDVVARSDYEKDKYGIDKVDFLERVNLFSGVYIEGTAIGGSSPYRYISSSNGRTAEIKIQPNTKYSWGREVPSRMNWGTATKKLMADSGDFLDGSIKFNMSGQGETIQPELYSFVSGPADEYLYLNTSTNGNEPFLVVVEGDLYEVGTHDYRRAKPAPYLDAMTENQVRRLISDYVPPSTERKIRVIFDGSRNLDIYVPSAKSNRWVKYNYCKIDSDSINMHQWRVLKTYIVDDDFSIIYDLDAQTEWEGAIMEVGASDYMGGHHGDERNTSIDFLFDGIELDMTSAFDITVGKEVRIVSHSILNRPDHLDQDLLTRIKISIWTKDQYSVENRYTCLAPFEIFESKITLMSCRYSDDEKTIIKYGRRDDTFIKTPVSSEGVGDLAIGQKEVRLMEFWGDDFYCSAECIADYEKYPNRKQSVANFSSQNRAKMYFDVTGRYQIQKDEELRNKSIYRILI